MPSPFDTIVAPITGSGPAAIAVVRLSGSDAHEIAARVFSSLGSPAELRHAYYGHFATGDDGLLVLFDERSYTGEPTAEMSIHGSPASVEALIDSCRSEGARDAEPGEFTQRAFLNGRLDLSRAEAVRDTIEAQTAAQLRLANLHREGALFREVADLRDQLVGVLAAVEASVDFSEEVGDLDRPRAKGQIRQVQSRVATLLETSETGKLLRRGTRIAIVGPPNAGKSSLLNALLGVDRAIVTPIAGTTRDYVEEAADFNGYPVVLIDTAGLRNTDDPVEAIGVQRTRAQAAGADIVWYVFDAATDRPDAAALGQMEVPVLFVANKVDLAPAPDGVLGVSATTREGLPKLIKSAVSRLQEAESSSTPMPNERQTEHLEAAARALEGSLATLDSDRPDDLVAVSLREAIHALGEITGETASPDMIERIFRDFCIGK